jgi:hypothetical protein
MYYKHTSIANDDSSVVSQWRFKLWLDLLTMLESSFTIVICLWCRPLVPAEPGLKPLTLRWRSECFTALLSQQSLLGYFECKIREVLLKGKAQYSWPPCTNQFRSTPFYIENIINLFYKTSYLNEEVNCTEPSPLS